MYENWWSRGLNCVFMRRMASPFSPTSIAYCTATTVWSNRCMSSTVGWMMSSVKSLPLFKGWRAHHEPYQSHHEPGTRQLFRHAGCLHFHHYFSDAFGRLHVLSGQFF